MKELFEQIKAILVNHPGTDSSVVLANALASACSSSYGVSMLDCSIKLDSSNRKLVMALTNVRELPGYSNALQDETLRWLHEQDYIK